MASRNGKKPTKDIAELYTSVSNELYDELAELEGQKITRVVVWEESLIEELAEQLDVDVNDFDVAAQKAAGTRTAFDLDLYVEGGLYLELYATFCYSTLDSDPLQGFNQTQGLLSRLVEQGVEIDEVAVDEDDQLVLMLAASEANVEPALYLVVSGWSIDASQEE